MTINTNPVGGTLLTASATSGVTVWLTQNATLISLTFTAASCIAGILFLFLNYRLNLRKQQRLEAMDERRS